MLLSKLGEHKPKAIGAIITLALVTLLILAGPANALSISLTTPATTPYAKGVTIDVPGEIQINSNEILSQSSSINLNLVGPSSSDNRVCSFSLKDGTDLSSCIGVTLELTNGLSKGYGYSYGYSYGYGFTAGHISYIVHIDTNQFGSGDYTIQTSLPGASSTVQPFSIAAPVCTQVLFRSKGYWENHPQYWAAKLPQTLGNEVVSNSSRVAQIFQRTTKIDNVKAPLLSIRFNLVDHPEAASYFVPNESVTVSDLAAQADALLSSGTATTTQLSLMKDRLNTVTDMINSCQNGTSPPPVPVCEPVTFRSKGYWDNHLSELATLLPQTVGSEVVSTSTRAHQIFQRTTKIDKVKAPLLSIRANLVNFPSAASLIAPGDSATIGDLADEADALLNNPSATTTQLSLMADRLNKVTGDLVSCPSNDKD